jgi:hypothetical protein
LNELRRRKRKISGEERKMRGKTKNRCTQYKNYDEHGNINV